MKTPSLKDLRKVNRLHKKELRQLDLMSEAQFQAFKKNFSIGALEGITKAEAKSLLMSMLTINLSLQGEANDLKSLNNVYKVSSKKPEPLRKTRYIHPQEIKDIDSDNGYMLPGIIDVHFHGCKGWDFAFGDENKTNAMLDHALTTGVTGVVATILTCPEPHLKHVLTTMRQVINERKTLPIIHGLHLEGPFLSKNRRGAHNPNFLQSPCIEKLKEWQELSGGNIKVITVAPELPGALDFIKAAVKMGIKVSLGHSEADWYTTAKAVEAGATSITHIFNAMSPIHHRQPNILSYALLNKELYFELIGDCEHVSPEIIQLLLHSRDNSKLLVVSDSMAVTDLEDGWYNFYENRIAKTATLSRLSDNSLFGGALMLPTCLQRLSKKAHVSWSTLGQSVWRNACDFLEVEPPDVEIYFDKDMVWQATKYKEEWYYTPE